MTEEEMQAELAKWRKASELACWFAVGLGGIGAFLSYLVGNYGAAGFALALAAFAYYGATK